MPLIAYIEKTFSRASRRTITQANMIIADYKAQGFDLTLRQLYYQMVAADLIENNQLSYKRLGETINNARLAGLIDWLDITDRTRNLRGITHWESPDQIIRATSASYAIDKWNDQPYRVEVWVEKDALIGVIGRACDDVDVDYFSCRGYTSASEMWLAAQRLRRYASQGQTPVVLHFGDHDPSGLDMTRDITDRLTLFAGRDIEVRRLALNKDQIDKYEPPPNPAKVTDSRATKYIAEHGHESWELDALKPTVIAELIAGEVAALRDAALWQANLDRETSDRKILDATGANWKAIDAFTKKKFLDKKPRRKPPVKKTSRRSKPKPKK